MKMFLFKMFVGLRGLKVPGSNPGVYYAKDLVIQLVPWSELTLGFG